MVSAGGRFVDALARIGLQRQALRHPHRREGDDEGRQPQRSDRRSVHRPDTHPDKQGEKNRRHRAVTMLNGERSEHGRKPDCGSNRQVDAPSDDDKRSANRRDADDGRLRQNRIDVARGEEARRELVKTTQIRKSTTVIALVVLLNSRPTRGRIVSRSSRAALLPSRSMLEGSASFNFMAVLIGSTKGSRGQNALAVELGAHDFADDPTRAQHVNAVAHRQHLIGVGTRQQNGCASQERAPGPVRRC